VPILNEQIQYVFEKRKIGYDKLAVSTITTALASKLLTEKIIETKMKQHESNKGAENK
jgi:hypothetical protein